MKISYIIITHNSKKYVGECLKCIYNLNGYENEIFIVDNGSTDNTVNIIKEYKNKYKLNLWSAILSKNYGVTISRNIALKAISDDSDFVCIIDSDAFVTQLVIDKLTENLNDDNIGIIAPKLTYENGESQLSARKFPTPKIKICKALPIKKIQESAEKLEKISLIENKINEVGYLISAFWIMRKEVFDKVGFFDEKIFIGANDLDYCMRMHLAGYKVVLNTSVSMIHLYQRITHQKFFSNYNKEHVKSLMYFFNKYKNEFKLSCFNEYIASRKSIISQ